MKARCSPGIQLRPREVWTGLLSLGVCSIAEGTIAFASGSRRSCSASQLTCNRREHRPPCLLQVCAPDGVPKAASRVITSRTSE